MARGLTVQVEGIDQVVRNLRPAVLGPPMRRYLERSAAASARDIRKALQRHQFRGETLSSIQIITDRRRIPAWAEGGAYTEQAKWLETGTRPHFPRIDKDLAEWAKQRGLDPYAVAQGIARKGTKAHRIGRRPRFAARARAKRYAADAAADIVRRMGG